MRTKVEFPSQGQNLAGLLEIADRCPIHKTLHNNPHVVTTLVDE